MKRTLVTRLALVALVSLGGTTAAVTVAAPANAVPGLVRVTAISANDSVSVKEAVADCPAGTRVLGGGGAIINGGGNVHLIRLQALPTTDAFAAAAAENLAFAGNWQVQSFAICGQAPAGLEYVAHQEPSNSASNLTTQRECPAGKTAISYGARVTGDGGQVFLTAFGPTPSLNGSKVSASEDESGTPLQWALWAHVVCANPLPGQELVWADDVPADSSNDQVRVLCPTGKRVHGLGSLVIPSFGEVFHRSVIPNSTLTIVDTIAIEDTTGAAHNWWTRVFAVCAL